MAENRGGYRKPPARGKPAGPGKFSERNDRNQPIREPDIDMPDLQYGDRSTLTAAQHIAPIRQGGTPPMPSRSVTGQPAPSGGGAGLPPWLIDMPSNRPEEPVTAGLDAGPGPGSEALSMTGPSLDEREMILEALYATYGNKEALAELQQMRGERAGVQAPIVPQRSGMPTSAPEFGTVPQRPGPETLEPEA